MHADAGIGRILLAEAAFPFAPSFFHKAVETVIDGASQALGRFDPGEIGDDQSQLFHTGLSSTFQAAWKKNKQARAGGGASELSADS